MLLARQFEIVAVLEEIEVKRLQVSRLSVMRISKSALDARLSANPQLDHRVRKSGPKSDPHAIVSRRCYPATTSSGSLPNATCLVATFRRFQTLIDAIADPDRVCQLDLAVLSG
jgi:hypothetical protein